MAGEGNRGGGVEVHIAQGELSALPGGQADRQFSRFLPRKLIAELPISGRAGHL
jgi:hypothetical protein